MLLVHEREEGAARVVPKGRETAAEAGAGRVEACLPRGALGAARTFPAIANRSHDCRWRRDLPVSGAIPDLRQTGLHAGDGGAPSRLTVCAGELGRARGHGFEGPDADDIAEQLGVYRRWRREFYIFADAWTCVYRIGLPAHGTGTWSRSGRGPASTAHCGPRSRRRATCHTGLTAEGLARLDALIRRETVAAKVVA